MIKFENHIFHTSIWILIFRLLVVEAFFVSFYWMAKYLTGFVFLGEDTSFGNWLNENLLWIASIHILEVFILVMVVLFWSSTIFSFSPQSIIIKEGVFTIRQNMYHTKHIESVKVRQSLWGIIFGFGTIILYAPTIKETIRLPHINHPTQIADKIEQYIQQVNEHLIAIEG